MKRKLTVRISKQIIIIIIMPNNLLRMILADRPKRISEKWVEKFLWKIDEKLQLG